MIYAEAFRSGTLSHFWKGSHPVLGLMGPISFLSPSLVLACLIPAGCISQAPVSVGFWLDSAKGKLLGGGGKADIRVFPLNSFHLGQHRQLQLYLPGGLFSLYIGWMSFLLGPGDPKLWTPVITIFPFVSPRSLGGGGSFFCCS